MNNNNLPEVKEIDISLIDAFPNHHFKVVDNEKMLPGIGKLSDNPKYNNVGGLISFNSREHFGALLFFRDSLKLVYSIRHNCLPPRAARRF